MRQAVCGVLAGVLVVALAGCGKPPDPVTVRGKVVQNKKTKGGVLVTFWPQDSRQKMATVVADDQGQFELQCVPGKYKVTIIAPSQGAEAAAEAGGPAAANNPSAPARGGPGSISRKANDPTGTRLSVDVPSDGLSDVVLSLDE
jgi:hypothetical protein